MAEKSSETATINSVFIAEFCDHGDLYQFIYSKHDEDYISFKLQDRIKLVISLLNAVKALHNSPFGVSMMCDMHARRDGLDQFLVSKDYRVVISDIDFLPIVSDTSLCTMGADFIQAYIKRDYNTTNFKDLWADRIK